MTNYIELSPTEKLELLNAHSMGMQWTSLDDRKWCLHCEAQFTGRSARVYRGGGELWLECGTPGCDGSPIDWADYPWRDENHPATKAHEALEKLTNDTESGDPEKN